MPYAAKTPCKGCGRPIHGRYCEICQQAGRAKEQRPSSTQRGYGARWQKASKAYLQAHPLCVDPSKPKRHPLIVVAATEVDHRIPHKGDMALFWDSDNWQGLCHDCHSYKTAREDGGFGHSS